MRNFKITLLIAISCILLGYACSYFAVSYFKTELPQISFLLLGVVLLPLGYLANTLKELSNDNLYNGLKPSERRRMEDLVKIKRMQLYCLIFVLIFLTVISIVIIQFVPSCKAQVVYFLTGLAFADIVFIMHSLKVNDGIADFKRKLKQHQDDVSFKTNLLSKLNSDK
ncbi:TPA: hypothetical protein QB250_000771 [Pasteurella multocida]|nr:hypothetical protein [Pasteurella multocida]